MPFTVDGLLDVLALEELGPDRYRARNLDTGHFVVFGGQLMAQTIAAAGIGHEDKTVKTLHIVFARAGAPDQPLDIAVDRVHRGRAMASSTVTISQGERICTRSMVLLSADEPDLIRHADRPTTAPGPDDVNGCNDVGGLQVKVVGGVDVNDPDAVGPADLDVWTRFVGAPDDPATGQALLAYVTDGFLIGTAMRPHKGIGIAQSHVTLSTGVLSHTITFHEPVLAAEWHLLSQHSPYAGRGRSYGQAGVYREDGQLVASFVQDAMIRPMPQGSSGL